jgi:hypothetical protein
MTHRVSISCPGPNEQNGDGDSNDYDDYGAARTAAEVLNRR